MPITFRCTSCRQKLSISTRKAGHEVSCPACGERLVVPAADADAAPAEELASAAPPPVADEAAEQRHPEVAAERQRDELVAARVDAEESEDFALRKAATDFEEMDLTPMVDVTFLLLIFFMITAAFSLTKTIEVPNPDPEDEGAAQSQTMEDLQQDSIFVEIDENNAIRIDESPTPVADASRLADALADARRTQDKHELIVKAHPRAYHESIVAVLDAANEVNFTRIRLAKLAAEE